MASRRLSEGRGAADTDDGEDGRGPRGRMAVGGTLDDGSQLSDEKVGGVAQMAVTEEHSTISCCSLKQAGQRYGMRCDLGGRQRIRAGRTGCGEGGGAA
jgi:hypothetical protein